ncbi:MAG: hypothetical protein KGR26_15000 [Cyanobacteria bacterium REEB65]|nr:hypothetical protein [Cyanobacteria bacterium REEB65]
MKRIGLPALLVVLASCAVPMTAPISSPATKAIRAADIASDLTLDQLMGAQLVAHDGTPLGTFASEYDTDSIFNPYGAYGNPYGTTVYNAYGDYGENQSSEQSPWNPNTTTPPTFEKNGQVVAYLTVNLALSPRVSPDNLSWIDPSPLDEP